jgi:lipopolysaccharide/colanic/teichoic acid biosynthesis glycosyltransferase
VNTTFSEITEQQCAEIQASTFSEKSSWPDSAGKRAFDLGVALIGLILLSPLFLVAAIAVKLSSPGSILFRQVRAGKGGRKFVILKFRTMRVSNGRGGPTVTTIGDDRLTAVGRIFRRLKIDELPQLINVIRGDMSLVGARPKVPHHQIRTLQHRPGITGAASLAFRREEELLHGIPEHSLDDYQVHVLMPLKQELDDEYMRRATFFSDMAMLFKTVAGRGEAIDSKELRTFQHSLVSLNSALKMKAAAEPELSFRQAS